MLSLEQKLKLWVKITGVNPDEEQKSYTIYFDDRLSEYDIRRMDEKIKEALNYDTSGLFAEAYLCHFFKEYIKQRKIHLEEYISNASIKEYLEDVCLLNQELLKSDAEKLISDETDKAMAFYGLKADKLTVFDIAEIRTCANNCIEKNLHTLQISSGPTQNDGFKMSREIRMYKDLNALALCAAKGNVDGVSMAYIRDEKEITHSYFTFIIKNGKNLYLLTDKPVFKHPLQREYKRCPGRDMYRRIEGNLFPYETVANIDTSDLWGNGRYGTRETCENLSTTFKEDKEVEKYFEVIGTIDVLEQAEAFWFVLMLSLIKDKFYDKEAPQLTLTYTGNQIQHPAIEKSENALIVQNNLPSISMNHITFEDIDDIAFDEHYEKHYKSNHNQYLIERYKERINEDVLNILTRKDADSICDLSELSQSKKLELHPFDITNECGTAEELKYRQKWIGRYNYAMAIKKYLQNDYNKNYQEIYGNIQNRIESRLEDIVILFLKNELLDRKGISHHVFDHVYDGDKIILGKMMSFDKWWDEYPSSKYRFGVSSYNRGNKADYRCAISGNAPGVAIYIKPSTTYALCQICGCNTSELPEFIQHWSKSRHYHGNEILSNIDPVAYLLEDPFNEMDFSFSIILSKKEYLRLCVVAGVEAKKFWLEEKPRCLREGKEVCYGDWKYVWREGNQLRKKCDKCKYYKGNIEKVQ